MHVRDIQLQNFMSHDATDVRLPECGIVVITGDNGSGKSSLVEALPATLWGKTLRGSPPWRVQRVTSSTVTTSGPELKVTRTRKGSRSKLAWEGSQHDTATAAQAALDSMIPDFDTWRRCNVFSSADANHFSLATDADRKRLLENILGLARFDVGLKACRVDLKSARLRVVRAEKEQARLTAELSGTRKRLEDLSAALGPQPVRPDNARAAQLAAAAKAAEQELVEVRSKARELTVDLGGARSMQRRAESALENIEAVCSRCGRAMDPKAIKAAKVAAAQEAEAASREIRAIQARLDVLADESEELQAAAGAAREQHDEQHRLACELAGWEKREAAQKARRAQVDKERARLEGEVEDIAEEGAAARVAVSELDAAEVALGLRGIRAHVLGRARAGIEQIANAWLCRIFPGVEVSLGGDDDKITLSVSGLPHPYGYKGASGGQRRRMDVALLLALAEVAAGTRAARPGTLWFDEVFDTLDNDGCEAVAGALEDMASDRCLVVVTHSAPLADRLTAALRLHVEAGAVSTV